MYRGMSRQRRRHVDDWITASFLHTRARIEVVEVLKRFFEGVSMTLTTQDVIDEVSDCDGHSVGDQIVSCHSCFCEA